MRTILTVLGVLIGTASIVVMLSLGFGLKQAMLDSIGSAGGITEIFVYSDEGDMGLESTLLSDDTIESFRELDFVENVEPQIMYYMPVLAGKYEGYITIIGASPEYLEKIELEQGTVPEEGGSFSVIAGNQVVTDFFESATGVYPYYENDEIPDVDLMKTPLVGGIEKESAEEEDISDMEGEDGSSDYVDPLFSEEESEDLESEDDFFSGESEDTYIDDTFADNDYSSYDEYDEFGDSEISYSSFTSSTKRVQVKVSGVTEGDVETYTEYSYCCYTTLDALRDFLKQNYNANEIIPYQPTDKDGKPYRDLKYNQAIVKVDEAENVEAVLQEIQDMGFEADANKEWLEEIEKEFMIIEAVLGGIGAISLLVAAIGIANTMTMSTYERTKEIGVMKVLGCGLGNIRSMFLAEAAFIGCLGGIAGVLLSYLLSFLANSVLAPVLMSDYGDGTKISLIPLWLVAVAIVFSTIIGMIAGFFPAQRATKLSPLAAIRNE